MLALLPRHLPSWADLLEDIGNPAPDKLAKAMGVTVRSIRRWKAAGKAPLPVMLALYWVTRWGQSEASTRADWTLEVHRQLAEALKRDNDELRAQLAAIGQISDFGSANDPSPAVPARPADSPATARPTLRPDPLTADLWLTEAELRDLLTQALHRAHGFAAARRTAVLPSAAARETAEVSQGEPVEPTTVHRAA